MEEPRGGGTVQGSDGWSGSNGRGAGLAGIRKVRPRTSARATQRHREALQGTGVATVAGTSRGEWQAALATGRVGAGDGRRGPR